MASVAAMRAAMAGPPRFTPVQAQVCFRLDGSRDAVVAAGRDWFESGVQAIGHELRDRLHAAVAERKYLGDAHERRIEGEIESGFLVKGLTGEGRATWSGTYSAKSFQRLLNDLDRLPNLAVFDVRTWVRDEGQEPQTAPWPGPPSVEFHWTRLGTTPDWLMLYLGGSESLLVGDPDRDEALVGFLRQIADRHAPVCGEAGYKYAAYRAALEDALGDLASDSVPHSETMVRSYSWLTIISDQIGDRLGGVDKLRNTGAFHDVVHLANGGYFLQATRRFHDYQVEHAQHIARVLAPFLPSRKPRMRGTWDMPNMIVPEDHPDPVPPTESWLQGRRQ